jgi:hypothetical protein
VTEPLSAGLGVRGAEGGGMVGVPGEVFVVEDAEQRIPQIKRSRARASLVPIEEDKVAR